MTPSEIHTKTTGFLNEDKSLACIHCGLCLSSCPTYLETGNENDSPRGRIYQMRALEQGSLPLSTETIRHIDLCLGCRACEAACPSGVAYGELLESTREHIDESHDRGLFERFLRNVLIEKIFPFTKRVDLALKPAVFAKRFGFDRYLPDFFRRFTDLAPANLVKRKKLPEFSPAIAKTKLGRVGFITGCVMDVMFNQTNWNSIRLLNLAGYDVVTPTDQPCCGALHAHSGKLTDARATASRLMSVFESIDLDHIVINAAGCGSTLKDYGHLFSESTDRSNEANQFSTKVLDISEALSVSEVFIKALENIEVDGTQTELITYHEACHLSHAQGVTTEPRQLIKLAAGSAFVELPESDVCCGSAGTYNLTEPQMAERLKNRKLANLVSTGANKVISTNPGCLLQILAGCESEKLKVLHIADYLASVLFGDSDKIE